MRQEFRVSTRGQKAIGVAIALVMWTWILWYRGSWPEVYTFWLSTGDVQGKTVLQVPVHLGDDVMIVMRTGQVLLETGVPALNHGDLAQPATSYLLPYVAAFLLFFLPANVAVVMLAVLGAAAVAVTLTTIVVAARSTFFGVALAILLAATSTNAAFTLGGWDHLFQGMFLALATALVVSADDRFTKTRLLTVSLLLCLGTLMRLDGIVIAAGLIVTAFLIDRRWRQVFLYLLLPFLLLIGTSLAVNYGQFRHFTPTTSRLKLGASPSLRYSFEYIWDEGILTYSAATLLAFLTILALIAMRTLDVRHMLPVTIGAAVTAVVATLNSDAFPSARMFWVPAVVMACGLAVRMPQVFSIAGRGGAPRATKGYSDAHRLHAPTHGIAALAAALGFVLLLSLVGPTPAATGIRGATVGRDAVDAHETARNYLLAEWMNANLNPVDGPIGVFYLGTSFRLPRFEIADFLGKGDEQIAETPVRYGAPGHNKWDFNLTLQKWHPQAIIGNKPDPNDPVFYRYQQAEVAYQLSNFGFGSALAVDPDIRRQYQWCEVVEPLVTSGQPLGLLLRNDVATRPSFAPNCRVQWPPPSAP